MEDFNKIYSDNHKMILGFINNKIGDLVTSEELANDVFMKVYKNLYLFDPEKSQMKTWIINITINTIIDYYRKKKLETISLNKDFDNGEDKAISFVDKMVDNNQTPYQVLQSKEKMRFLDNTIADLKPKDFEIAYYFFKKELNYQEISDTLAIPLGSVKARIFRIRKILQTKLETI